MLEDVCPKCKGKKVVKEKDGSIHTCFDCLSSGKLDQHNKDLKSADELRIRL